MVCSCQCHARTRRCAESRHVNNNRPCAPRCSEHSRTGAHAHTHTHATAARGQQRPNTDERTVRFRRVWTYLSAAEEKEAKGGNAAQAFPTQKPRLSALVSGFSASSTKNPPREKKNQKFSSPVRVGGLLGLRLEARPGSGFCPWVRAASVFARCRTLCSGFYGSFSRNMC